MRQREGECIKIKKSRKLSYITAWLGSEIRYLKVEGSSLAEM